MDMTRQKIIDDLLNLIHFYEAIAKELTDAYLYKRERMPQSVERRVETIGIITDGIREAIQIIYLGGKKDDTH